MRLIARLLESEMIVVYFDLVLIKRGLKVNTSGDEEIGFVKMKLCVMMQPWEILRNNCSYLIILGMWYMKAEYCINIQSSER